MAERETAEPLDEAKLARLVARGLPVATVLGAVAVAFVTGPATSILVLAAGTLLGVIALFWGSIRVLSGDSPLDPELEALENNAGEDPLGARRTMLLRALKDLETERGLGKIATEDYEQVTATYRAELKAVLRKIDDALAPHREKAEALVRAHLGQGELAELEPTLEPTPAEPAPEPVDERVACPTCAVLNEKDAKFCKECATALRPAKAAETEKVDEDA